MLIRRVIAQFCTQFENKIKQARRTVNLEAKETITNEETEQNNSLKKLPFYRFPHGLSKNFYILAAPLMIMDVFQMQAPYFSYQLTNAFCQMNDLYIFGFAGAVGAICACHFASKERVKYIGLYSSAELVMLMCSSMFMYNLSPLLFGSYFLSTLFHLIWYNYTKNTQGVPKTYNNLFHKSIIFTSLWIFVVIYPINQSAGGIVLLNQEFNHIEMKIKELQKLSDSLK